MDKKTEATRMFYKIGDVARMFDVNSSLIRFWEQQFDIIKPKKNAKGDRMFTPADIDNFHKIHYLVKECGMTLDGAKQRLALNGDELDRKFEAVKRLKQVRSKLELLQKSLTSA